MDAPTALISDRDDIKLLYPQGTIVGRSRDESRSSSQGTETQLANLLPANRIELGLGSEQQPVAGDRWRGQRHLVLRIDV
jgi:hypothetical protein